VISLVFDESANRLYSASSDSTIKVWDLHTFTCIQDIVVGYGLSLTSNRLYSGSSDNTIKVWNTVSFECVSTMEGHSLSDCLGGWQ
jgi:WD40 repeat protein